MLELHLKCDGTQWHREGKWRGNWRMQWVASTLNTTSEHGVSNITTANAHTSAASSRLNWLPLPIQMDSSVSPKDEIWFLRVCHHISHAVYSWRLFLRLMPIMKDTSWKVSLADIITISKKTNLYCCLYCTWIRHLCGAPGYHRRCPKMVCIIDLPAPHTTHTM